MNKPVEFVPVHAPDCPLGTPYPTSAANPPTIADCTCAMQAWFNAPLLAPTLWGFPVSASSGGPDG